jgi:hypothetical protein
MHRNPDLLKHLRKASVGTWLEFGVAEYLDLMSDVLDIELSYRCERVITPQTDDEGRL